MGPEAGESMEGKDPDWRLLICINRRLTPAAVSCAGRGAERLFERVEALIRERRLPVRVEPVFCFGRCGKGPNLRLAPGGEFYSLVDEAALPEIVDRIAAVVTAPAVPRRSENPSGPSA